MVKSLKRAAPRRQQTPAQKRANRLRVAKELLLPTAPNEYGTTALVESDLNSSLVKMLSPYNTIGNQVFFWRSTLDLGILTQGNADIGIGLYFSLSQCPGSADFAACFDQYKLRAVSVEFMPQVTTNTMATTSTSYFPRLYTVIDYDDAAVVTRAAAQQYDTCVVSPPGTGVMRAVEPRMAVAAYSGTFTSYANMKDQWIDVASTSVQHYGVKAVVEAGATSQTAFQSYVISAEYFWEFRASR